MPFPMTSTLKAKLPVLCLVLFFGVTSLFCGPAPDAESISLNGLWKISLGGGEEQAQAEYRDREWDDIVLPGSVIAYVERKGGGAAGTVWVRKRFIAPEKWAREGAGLSLGKIGNADRTFVNGVLVGSTGGIPPKGRAMWNQARHYFVPPGTITPGENVVAVEIAYSFFGQARGDITVDDIGTWRLRRDTSLILHTLNYAVMAVCGAVGLIILLIYVRRPRWTEYPYFLLQLVPGFFVVYETCAVVPLWSDTLFRLKFLGFMWTALVVFHLGFLHRLYGFSRKKIEVSLWGLLALNTILMAFGYDVTRHRWIAVFVIMSITPLALYNLSVHMTALRRQNAQARMLFLPGVVLSLGAAHDGIVYLSLALGSGISAGGYRFDVLIFGYCAAMMFLGAALILVHRFMNALGESEDLNRNLEKRVEERTEDLSRSLRELSVMVEALHLEARAIGVNERRKSISPATEEKVKKAVVFLHENFMHDISREGLASLVGLNCDHLGKAFRIYTGKKIQNYINDLRVRSAAVMLRDKERKIIDIAFESGFESLRTFNRAFTRLMSISPKEYRKKIE